MKKARYGRFINTNWKTLHDQPLTTRSVNDLLQNTIPAIRHRNFLSADECSKLVDIVQKHQIGSYNQERRFKAEADIDILGRVATLLEEATGLETRIAREDGRAYFAGLLRAVKDYIQIHSDYAPYDGTDWEIGKITSQLTWNILLRQVPGGDTIIYDRQWQGESDEGFRKAFPRYAYEPSGVQGSVFKALTAIEGDLTFFNSRYVPVPSLY
ncbi:hypothetical protein ONZ43_g338 [Nemania bipapillata]|uniref:Uncharacterized protein n=1 Tax=Nemania bipapillata TaxID=110536 RepID=A0ACC2J8R4_9PEZI|nr:hypothetical protein ONZ43_g338 [Nemania bipapillata]